MVKFTLVIATLWLCISATPKFSPCSKCSFLVALAFTFFLPIHCPFPSVWVANSHSFLRTQFLLCCLPEFSRQLATPSFMLPTHLADIANVRGLKHMTEGPQFSLPPFPFHLLCHLSPVNLAQLTNYKACKKNS